MLLSQKLFESLFYTCKKLFVVILTVDKSDQFFLNALNLAR
jgi:hypothetical protein